MYTGLIMGYRRGTNTQYENQVIIMVDDMGSRKEVSRLVGWRVLYRDKYGNTYRGKIVRVHGNKNTVIAVFKPNLPGQAIGGLVYIYPRNAELVFEEEK